MLPKLTLPPALSCLGTTHANETLKHYFWGSSELWPSSEWICWKCWALEFLELDHLTNLSAKKDICYQLMPALTVMEATNSSFSFITMDIHVICLRPLLLLFHLNQHHLSLGALVKRSRNGQLTRSKAPEMSNLMKREGGLDLCKALMTFCAY